MANKHAETCSPRSVSVSRLLRMVDNAIWVERGYHGGAMTPAILGKGPNSSTEQNPNFCNGRDYQADV
ncbi:Uncharacterized protein HZ326_23729 [Fusarium oxysporum f. sp. albedinis]|nr:Uncharacterized protein HZ326_23729 [Fusarium oxysporum f. sp. albedinis]